MSFVWAHSANQPTIYRQAWCDLLAELGYDPARIFAGARIFLNDRACYELHCDEKIPEEECAHLLGKHELPRRALVLPVTNAQVEALERAWKSGGQARDEGHTDTACHNLTDDHA